MLIGIVQANLYQHCIQSYAAKFFDNATAVMDCIIVVRVIDFSTSATLAGTGIAFFHFPKLRNRK